LLQLRTGAVSDETIQSGISELENQLMAAPTSAEQFAANYMRFQRENFDPKYDKILLAAVQTLTPAQVRTVAEEFLFSNRPYRQLTLADCEDALKR
jgi:hypothetical protein